MLSTIFHEMSFTTVTFIVVISLCAIYLHLKYSQSIAHKAPAPMSREHIVVREVVARSPEDRPVRDTVDGNRGMACRTSPPYRLGRREFRRVRLAAARGRATATARDTACRHDPSAIPWHHDGVVAGYWQDDAGIDRTRDRGRDPLQREPGPPRLRGSRDIAPPPRLPR